MEIVINPGKLTFNDFRNILNNEATLSLANEALSAIEASYATIASILKEGKTVYGINTGFGSLANTRIEKNDLADLQRRIVLSHAAGTGELLDDTIVRLMIALKINSLSRGHSGVQQKTIDALITLFNAKIYPCIPAKGSVGASGDLAPLAHLALLLIGEGEARHNGKTISASAALEKAGLSPLSLAPKEGLALLNGTQASTALAIAAWLKAEDCFFAAITAGALSIEAVLGSRKPFDPRIQIVRGHETQIKVAAWLTSLLENSELMQSHTDCSKVQDPYCLRCQPQVMGACLSHLYYTRDVLLTEANAVSDNPLIFADDNEILSGGNFHAEPVALAADAIAVSLAEIGALSERRTALLVDPNFSQLPAFLVKEPGLNSGFMIAQVTSAALASENKSLAHPASVDSLPTSANQEDHVSMATFAARRLHDMADNVTGIVGIELLAAAQGIDLRRPLKSSDTLEEIHSTIRSEIPPYDEDRFFAPDIAKIKQMIQTGRLRHILGWSLVS